MGVLESDKGVHYPLQTFLGLLEEVIK